MKILLTGSNGLVGSALVPHLTGLGHYVVRLVRSDPDRARGDILWEPVSGKLERARLEGFDAVIHLAGENLMRLWTPAHKHRIVASRVQATEFLSEALAALQSRPKVLLSASAIGYYGSRGDEWLNERSRGGSGFLAELCQDWEGATTIATRAGIRVVNLRLGLVLSRRGGMLQKMRPAFRSGAGGSIGSGRQFMSWIAIDDLVGAIQHLLTHERIAGPVNLVAPDPVSNRDFTRALARELRRPALLPVPAFLLRLLPGGFADETMLASQRVEPAILRESGYKFAFSDLADALHHLCGDGRP
jgi:uncharacterized protein (TIGR01777 family)